MRFRISENKRANDLVITQSRTAVFQKKYSRDSEYQRQLSKANIKSIADGKNVKYVNDEDISLPDYRVIDCTDIDDADARRTFPLRNSDPKIPLPIDYIGLHAQKKRMIEEQFEIQDEEPNL